LTKPGPYGQQGTVMWICDQCTKEIDDWEATSEPSETDSQKAIDRADALTARREPLKPM
jgi:hypothetical protein